MLGSISKKFHKLTNFNFPIGSLPSNPQYWPKEWTEIHHKEYPRLPKIPLSYNFSDLGTLKKSLELRHSAREFNVNETLTEKELSTLLYYSAGTKPAPKNQDCVRRHYPSGGARYPLETYLVIQRVQSIEKGIYHYNIKKHALETLSTDVEDLTQIRDGLYYPWSREAALILFITSVWDRNFIKYKDRGYRITLTEAGHMAQNLALISASLDIGCCNSVGFNDIRISSILNIENGVEDPVYMALLGK